MKKNIGFTLLELLATLTIMAVIAAILFPFVVEYVKKANHDTAVRSLRVLQDAIERCRVANPNLTNWEVGNGISGNVLTNYRQLSMPATAKIISDISDVASTNRTILLPSDGFSISNIVIITTAPISEKADWEVMRYRRNTNVIGVDRKGNDITNEGLFLVPSRSDIDAAFQ